MGMDIRRGMPLPLLACYGATGDTAALRDALVKAQSEDDNAQTIFYDRFTLHAILLAQTITSRISHDDLAYWRAWIKQSGAHAIDVSADRKDPIPGVIHALSEMYLGLKAIPRFLRSTPSPSPALSRFRRARP
jgi:D-aspartate ligase